jgi:hypothetical protein
MVVFNLLVVVHTSELKSSEGRHTVVRCRMSLMVNGLDVRAQWKEPHGWLADTLVWSRAHPRRTEPTESAIRPQNLFSFIQLLLFFAAPADQARLPEASSAVFLRDGAGFYPWITFEIG